MRPCTPFLLHAHAHGTTTRRLHRLARSSRSRTDRGSSCALGALRHRHRSGTRASGHGHFQITSIDGRHRGGQSSKDDDDEESDEVEASHDESGGGGGGGGGDSSSEEEEDEGWCWMLSILGVDMSSSG
jgi:hypothetical protein